MHATPTPDDLRAMMFARLPRDAADFLRKIIPAAGGSAMYLVGGAVRDLLLDRGIVDVDLAIEGDAAEVMSRAIPGAKLTAHGRFGTATVVTGGARIDAAATRTETYERPGALPVVAPASIEEDLSRRDFTINAMALRITGDAELLDPCRGRRDLAVKAVRVLHDRSFIDDATRIFRALRYAARLQFHLEAHTSSLLREGVRYVATIGGERLRRELELTLSEKEAGSGLEAADGIGALSKIHSALRWNAVRSSALQAMGAAIVPRAQLGFALMASGASPAEAEAVCGRLRLKRDDAAAVRGLAAMHGIAAMLRRPHAKPSGVAMVLERYPAASVAAFAATAGDPIVGRMALRYLEEWRHEKPLLSGRDLQALGVPEGPQLQKGLQLIRAARLDGWANDRRDEEALALRFAKSIRDSNAAPDAELHLNGD
jgi:tRNA nucleotidyltransferase (CCA-adding enzyme)